MNEEIQLSKYLTTVFETESEQYSEWFGYYNYDTLNSECTKMLCNRIAVDGVAPQKGMKIELGFYDIPTGHWHHIDYSDSWNWQQGAMLQWIPGEENKNKVIYNLSKDGKLISRIYDTSTGESRDIDWPIYGITPDGKKSITLDLERSRWCRAYHYKSIENISKEGRIYEDDGIFEVDLDHNSVKRIIQIQDVIAINHEPSFDCMKHWLEHIMISPDGSRFVFLHRFSSESNVYDYRTRICVAEIDGSNLQVIDGQNQYEWSHFGWAPDNSFCIYSYRKGRFKCPYTVQQLMQMGMKGWAKFPLKFFCAVIGKLPKAFAHKIKDDYNYYQFYAESDNGKYTLNDISNTSFYPIDGHPSFSSDGKYVMTDTYPKANGQQSLMIYNPLNQKIVILGDFYAYYKGTPSSCDLHPKLCRNNDYVVVDSAHNEKHHMLVYKIDWDCLRKELA